MIIEHLISYLSQVKGYLEGSEQKLATDPIDDIVKCLEEGKKYKQICKDLESLMELDQSSLYRDQMKFIKRRYFPKPVKKTITIEIEAKDEKELFRQLDKARYLIQERLQYDKFCNFDVCGEKVQVIIKDKGSD